MKTKISTVLIVMFLNTHTIAQVQLSGQLDVVLRNTSAGDFTNKTFKNYSNYDFYRTRLFFDAQPAENVVVFTQVLVDNGDFDLYSAYLRMSFLNAKLNFHVGLIPNTIGIWGPRTYSDKNPFIAVPLLYNYHSSFSLRGLDPGGDTFTDTADKIISLKGKGHAQKGLPILYDTCWNSGLEIFGSYEMFDWSVAALGGSVTHPTRQPAKDLPQFTGRITYYHSPELNASLSGYWGPYLDDEIVEALNDTTGLSETPADFINGGLGLSIVYSQGYFEFFSEAFWSQWDHPFLHDLNAFSAYMDFKYKFATQWYSALRAETMQFSEIKTSTGKKGWDYPLNRYEFVIGYKLNRNVIVKLDTQWSIFQDDKSLNDEIYALQISTTF